MIPKHPNECRALMSSIEEKVSREILVNWVIEACEEYRLFPINRLDNLHDYIGFSVVTKYEQNRLKH